MFLFVYVSKKWLRDPGKLLDSVQITFIDTVFIFIDEKDDTAHAEALVNLLRDVES